MAGNDDLSSYLAKRKSKIDEANGPTSWHFAKNWKREALQKWCRKCERVARYDQPLFYMEIAPKLLAQLDAASPIIPPVIPGDHVAGVERLYAELAAGKRAFLNRWLQSPIREYCRAWYAGRQRRKLADDAAGIRRSAPHRKPIIKRTDR